jgi:hypothetical protein
MYLSLRLVITHLLTYTSALQIASSLQWIEHTPQPYAIQNFYNGTSNITLTSGSVANLTNGTFDLAANAETQGLKQYAKNKNIRTFSPFPILRDTNIETGLIYVIVDAAYRLVARKTPGINALSDLRNKTIGTVKGTSSEVFVTRMLASAKISSSEYTLKSGDVCMKTPCSNTSLPFLLATGQIDAFGIWEPSPELAFQFLGPDNALVFQDKSVYREVYSLYSTTDRLEDPGKRRDIVEFVRALEKTLEVYRETPEKVYEFVAEKVEMDASVVEEVWEEHFWRGSWDSEELIELLVEEDAWLAGKDNRTVAAREELVAFMDESVLKEVRGG